MRFLLDTNLVSEIRRGNKGNRGVLDWANRQPEADFAISVISIKEIEVGILGKARKDPSQGLVLRAWFDEVLMPRYGSHVLDIDVAVARRAAALDVPDPRPISDGLIAATALVHDLTVVTRNTIDFLPTGVRLLNPFT
jgi:predicted nucleic acid-binding protein